MAQKSGESLVWVFLLGLIFGSGLAILLSGARVDELLEKLGLTKVPAEKKIERTRKFLEKVEKELES
jgi:hypothetical protein